jgi:hypothetical protein
MRYHSVAARLAGGVVLMITSAGKPDCYRIQATDEIISGASSGQ